MYWDNCDTKNWIFFDRTITQWETILQPSGLIGQYLVENYRANCGIPENVQLRDVPGDPTQMKKIQIIQRTLGLNSVLGGLT